MNLEWMPSHLDELAWLEHDDHGLLLPPPSPMYRLSPPPLPPPLSPAPSTPLAPQDVSTGDANHVPEEIAPPKTASLKCDADKASSVEDLMRDIALCAPETAALLPASCAVYRGTGGPPHIPGDPVVLAVVKLAAELRKEKKYVGHYAFVLSCLHYEERMHMWHGSESTDIIETWASWATDRCPALSRTDAIFCALSRDPDTGATVLRPALADVPMGALNHYVSAVRVPKTMFESLRCNTHLESFYLTLGVCPMPTVADGNCGLDVLVQARGLPQTDTEFQLMRERLAQYLLSNANDSRLISTLVQMGEIPAELVDQDIIDDDEKQPASLAIRGNGCEQQPGESRPTQSKLGAAVGGYSDYELTALQWAAGCHDASLKIGLALSKELPPWAVKQQVAAYEADMEGEVEVCTALLPHNGVNNLKRPHAPHQTPKLDTRLDDAKAFMLYLKEEDVDMDKPWPRGIIANYLRTTKTGQQAVETHMARDKNRHNERRVMHDLSRYLQRAVHTAYNMEKRGQMPEKSARIRGSGSFKVRHRQRTRMTGKQGAPRKAHEIRDSLFEWWSTIRFSIDSRVMTRLPAKVIISKAMQLKRDWVTCQLMKGVQVKSPRLDSHWLRGWTREYNVSFRKPTRTYKVPNWVLEQRLVIFWENCIRVRRAAQKLLGYDLEMDNVDQSPFHKNEAGSKDCRTLSIRGAPDVPLIESHSATRSRWSANTTVTSDCKAAVEAKDAYIPPLECMFKADGHILEAGLNSHINSFGFDWLSVSTSPKATYREQHILTFIRRHFPAKPKDRFRLFGLDMYGPQTTVNVQTQCWHQRRILINQPGGGTGVTQTNDTDLHKQLKADYVHEETELMMHLVRSTGRKCPSYNPQQCIDIMAKIWADPKKHVDAAKGYWRTGTLNALDGSEDNLICREAKVYWDRLDMPAKRLRVIEEIDEEIEKGRLRWTFLNIRRRIVPYPKTGHMDEIKEFQDDDFPQLQEGQAEVAGAEDGESDQSNDDAMSDVSSYDDEAWNDVSAEAPATACGGGGPASCARGSGPLDVAVGTGGLTYEQGRVAGDLEQRLATYDQARKLMEGIGDRSTAMSIARVIHSETRKATGRLQSDPDIAHALTEHLNKEFQEDAKHRIQYARAREVETQLQQSKQEAEILKKQNAAAKAKVKEAESLIDCGTAIKRYSPAMLGQGFANGGPAKCANARSAVLDRLLARGSELNAQEKNDWHWFKKEWDSKMAADHNKEWGLMFAGIAQNLLEELEHGESSVVADFMYKETARVLSDVRTVHV